MERKLVERKSMERKMVERESMERKMEERKSLERKTSQGGLRSLVVRVKYGSPSWNLEECEMMIQ